MDIDNIGDLFDEEVVFAIIHAKAATKKSKLNCVYPESLLIGILTMGDNKISNSLQNTFGINIKKLYDDLSIRLTKKNEEKDKKDAPLISRGVHNICKKSADIAMGNRKDGVELKISLQDLFVAILEVEPIIKKYFTSMGVDTEELFKDIYKVEPAKIEAKKKKKSALETYCVNLTQMAKENKFDPILGRDEEIENAITILCRRNKRNPILVGEAGTGKTALCELLAQRIASNTVPQKLLNCQIYSFNVSTLVAGTKYRGDFEQRIQSLIDEALNDEKCILFIDEMHTLVGSGASSGNSMDGANIMKPALARGLRCIGATTLKEYKENIEKDNALSRRFEKIIINEPNYDETKVILMGIKEKLEYFHKCIITDDAIEASIYLSERYVPETNFPDKSIDCLDTACAKYAWNENKDKPIVQSSDIAMVISKKSQIPVEIILGSDIQKIKRIEGNLRKKVIGQKKAIDSIVRVLKNNMSGIRNPNKPVGVFVFGGPSGVGKTYLPQILAESAFENKHSLIRLDMTEYGDKASITKIIGSPPSYIGFGDVDVVCDLIRRRPYSVLLLDEIEKGHPDVIRLFLQAMEDGYMTDSLGNKVNFRNLIIIMTGNFGLQKDSKLSLGFGNSDPTNEYEQNKKKLIEYCSLEYGEEFCNRIDNFVAFNNLKDEDTVKIIELRLNEFKERVKDKLNLIIKSGVAELLLQENKDHSKNGMLANRIVTKKIEPLVADYLLDLGKDEKLTLTLEVKNGKLNSRKRKRKV